MMLATCTNRIMAFSEGEVRDLLARFGSDVDILLGRPASVEACARTFATLDGLGDGPNPTGSVRWLVDTPERMREYAALATQLEESISISVEIDVGLHRGGARNAEQLRAMLKIIDDSGLLRFTGFMGYEGHVPFVPLDRGSPEAEFAAVQRRYAEFVRAGQDAFPALFEGPLVFNSGGSRTYHSYTDDLDTPVNEVAMGSAFFYPSNFHNLPETGLRTATFFATPVLRRLDPAELYPDPDFLPELARAQPDYAVWYVTVSGGFPGDRRYPRGLVPSPTATGDPSRIVNMMPNQGRWLGARGVPLDVGDFIFYQPWEADAVRWLAYLDVFRGGQLVDQWATSQPGIRLARDA
jgi:D-serine deaminase-like pyridoxal phosphate-dependent protein